jgi:nucleoside-diphosphate-sugar epimerase
LVGRGATCKSVVSRTNLAAAIGFALGLAGPGCETFNVSDRETFALNDLATLIATLAAAPPPRRVPAWLARCGAPLGDLLCALSGRDFPLTSSRLRAIEEVSVFPCDKLIAAGYVHPCSTQEALREMLHWMKSADDASAT